MNGQFSFDDINTRDYDVYVYFKEVDTVPQRIYQKFEIPGRNGEFLIDEGRYEDAPHGYQCIALDKNKGEKFLRKLASKVGYHRLQDSFNPDEFYEAVFNYTVEPKVATRRDAMKFDLKFTRKPQRFLVSGEQELEIESGDTLINPTLQDASPLLAAEGYGTINVNGYEIEIDSGSYGDITLALGTTQDSHLLRIYLDDTELLNNGDTITLKGGRITGYLYCESPDSIELINSVTDSNSLFQTRYKGTGSMSGSVITDFGNITFAKGTDSEVSNTTAFVVTRASTPNTETINLYITINYYASSNLIVISADSIRIGRTAYWNPNSTRCGDTIGSSSKSYLGNPTYIDCDLGEVYSLDSGSPISLNGYVDLGSDLPVLSPGSNTIAKDNTITSLKVTPRWWQI